MAGSLRIEGKLVDIPFVPGQLKKLSTAALVEIATTYRPSGLKNTIMDHLLKEKKPKRTAQK